MIIQEFLAKVEDVQKTGAATEHSYRSALEYLFHALDNDITALNEPKRIKCGAPDFIVSRGEIVIGHVEAKDIDVDLRAMKGANKDQQTRYLKALPNLIYTNCLEFDFYRDGARINSVSIADYLMGIQPRPEHFEALENQLRDFIAQRPQTITSSKKLATMMAGKAVLIKDILKNALEEDQDRSTELSGQYRAFREHLIHDISRGDFADIYAETITYGMFAARLHDTTLDDFSRTEALELLPKSNPFLRALFGYIAGPDLDDRIRWIIEDLADVFQACDVRSLMKDFGRLTQRNDPFLHFYETFLSEYNPKKRKARGVWYTPEPVVNFIVRAVDDVLIREFGLPMGLADTSKVTVDWNTGQTDKKGKPISTKKDVHRVQILDPATGTGTFLAEVIKQIAPKIKNVAEGMWSGYIEKDLIPRIHGFELLMASYAMCHMKLDMILTELGYKPSGTPPRLGVYLTNSLEEGEPANQTLPFAQWLSNEVKQANAIKRDMPIMCVIGNPPYSVSSQNKGPWIDNLLADYKRGLKERNIQPLSDDYVKFIRLAHHLIEKNGCGIVGFVTNNSYVDGIIHRQMRGTLAKTFDKIMVLDLHGSTNKGELAPDGSKDENVFDIRQGVAIVILVKTENSESKNLELYKSDLFGRRKEKYARLWEGINGEISWEKIDLVPPMNLFMPFGQEYLEYDKKGFSVVDLMRTNLSGVVSGHDSRFIAFKQNELECIDSNKRAFLLRPFDLRIINYDVKKLQRARYEIMKHMIFGKNFALITPRQAYEGGGASISNHVTGHKTYSAYNRNYFFPLYLYPSEQDLDQTRRVNFEPKLHKKLVELATHPKLGEPDEVRIFDYIYGVLHCPAYRETYKEFLKIDFPRIPWPSSPEAFWDIAEKGGMLRRLHLMEADAIGETPYPFKGDGDNVVDKPAYTDDGRVLINKDQYFEGVPEIAWTFYIGGYQPAQKWLKDRKGRVLSFEDVQHYQRIVKILMETDRIMKTIEMDLP